ncbi:MAG: molecular chaperone TorD family protein [Oscillospiraceae bacterium]|nr:molecular chaperone TorD family protein [Oscillospiraceae bacterium]
MDKQLVNARANMYRFLSRLYLLEVDETLWNALQKMAFPTENANGDLKAGYELMAAYLAANANGDMTAVLDDLAVDYARIFLSAGVAQGKAAFPYESVYTSRKHLVMQDSRMDVVALYAARGVTPSKDNYHVPEDHLGYLCEYMALLIDDGAEAEQKAFLKSHLLNWVSAFTVDMGKYAATDFYRGLAKLSRGFLQMEQGLLGA